MKTIAIDTNVVLDFKLKRHPKFTEIKKLFLDCINGTTQIYIPIIVFSEIEWVLRSYYKEPKVRIIEFFEELLLIDNVIVDNKEDIKLAVNLYKESSQINFTDSIIVTQIVSHDYDFLTYDKNLEKIYQSLQ